MAYREKIIDRQIGRNAELFALAVGEKETREERYPYVRILASILEQARPEWNQSPFKDRQIAHLAFKMSRGGIPVDETALVVRLRDMERGFLPLPERPEDVRAAEELEREAAAEELERMAAAEAPEPEAPAPGTQDEAVAGAAAEDAVANAASEDAVAGAAAEDAVANAASEDAPADDEASAASTDPALASAPDITGESPDLPPAEEPVS